jgi:hypothetical protein
MYKFHDPTELRAKKRIVLENSVVLASFYFEYKFHDEIPIRT